MQEDAQTDKATDKRALLSPPLVSEEVMRLDCFFERVRGHGAGPQGLHPPPFSCDPIYQLIQQSKWLS